MMKQSLAQMMAADAGTAPAQLDVERIREMIEALRSAQQTKAALEQRLEQVSRDITRLEQVDIPTLFDEVGVRRLDLDDLTVVVDTAYFPFCKKENLPELFQWLQAMGMDSIIKNEVKVVFGKGQDKLANTLLSQLLEKHFNVSQKKDVHPQTLRAFVREQIAAGTTLPAVLDPNPVRTTTIKEK